MALKADRHELDVDISFFYNAGAVERGGIACGGQHATDLRRQDELMARLLAQEVTDAVLRLSVPIERRRVVVAHATFPGGGECLLRLGLGDGDEQLSQGRGAEAELRDLHIGLSQSASRWGLHAVTLHSVLDEQIQAEGNHRHDQAAQQCRDRTVDGQTRTQPCRQSEHAGVHDKGEQADRQQQGRRV